MPYRDIRGLTDDPARRRMPRLGKIRLGERVRIKGKACTCQDPGGCRRCTYPRELDYFRVPPEVAAAVGEEHPRQLMILLPHEDERVNMPVAYKCYGAVGLKCTGNGEEAEEVDEKTGEYRERECPCERLEDGTCGAVATLNVILPRVSMGGVYQVVTGSYNSIIDLRSSMEWARSLVGRLALVPLLLERTRTETVHRDPKTGQRQRGHHWTLRLTVPANVQELNALRAISDRIVASPAEALALPALPIPARTPEEALEGAGVRDLEPEPPREPRRLPPPAPPTAPPAGKVEGRAPPAPPAAPTPDAPPAAQAPGAPPPPREREPGEEEEEPLLEDIPEDPFSETGEPSSEVPAPDAGVPPPLNSAERDALRRRVREMAASLKLNAKEFSAICKAAAGETNPEKMSDRQIRDVYDAVRKREREAEILAAASRLGMSGADLLRLVQKVTSRKRLVDITEVDFARVMVELSKIQLGEKPKTGEENPKKLF